MSQSVVLASQSPARRRLLEAAGVSLIVDSPRLDEEAVKESLKAEQAPPEAAAESLAELKALKVASRHPGLLVVGADQILVCDQDWYDKPLDREAAAAQLTSLSGRMHRLVTSVVVARDGQRLWHHREAPRLTLRSLTPDFIAWYLDQIGEAALASVGAYQLEGLGVQLMARVEGDHFSIQGLPLIPLLDFLRQNGVLPR